MVDLHKKLLDYVTPAMNVHSMTYANSSMKNRTEIRHRKVESANMSKTAAKGLCAICCNYDAVPWHIEHIEQHAHCSLYKYSINAKNSNHLHHFITQHSAVPLPNAQQFSSKTG